ncbi:MAG: hypothetical protein HFI09_02185 [Bacilli bacterium]|nr:hypothetical protein [Bacilli bacterium]
MRKHIDYFYKSYDGEPINNLERQAMYFNDYGYNLESTRRKTKSLEECSKKTGPNCLMSHIKREKG